MDDFTRKVASIENDLHDHRRRLQTIETRAKATIIEKVQTMQTTLVNGDGKISHVTSETRSRLSQLEYRSNDLSNIDLKPQMTWLSTRLSDIVSDFEMAQSVADNALYCVNDYTYQIMDVGQEVEASRSQLTDAERDGETIAQDAQNELRMSESLLAGAQARIVDKEREIRTKTSEANAKRERKKQLDAEVYNKNCRIREAERERERKKENAIVSGGVGILGIALAPFTFGTSLALTVGAGVGVGVNVSDMSDLKDEIRSMNSSISCLQSQITQADRDVTSLEREKSELQRLISRYEAEVTTRKRQQAGFRSEISNVSTVKGEISVLDNYAHATTSSVTERKGELQIIKQNLDSCSALLKERSLEMKTNSGFIERLMGKKYARKQESKRQLALMGSIVEVLDRIHTQMLALLPSSQGIKLLGETAWMSGGGATVDSVVDVSEPIPEISREKEALVKGKPLSSKLGTDYWLWLWFWVLAVVWLWLVWLGLPNHSEP